MIMNLGLSEEYIRMDYIICLQASVIFGVNEIHVLF